MQDIRSAGSIVTQRCAGICMHLTSLPGRYGVGDIGGAARNFVDVLREMRVGVWQFLPNGPTAFGDSPYQLLSAFAGNEMLLDPDALLELDLVSRREVAPLLRLPQGNVAFGRLIPLKDELLQHCARRFTEAADTSLRAAYEQFVATEDAAWLADYARFRVLKQMHGGKAWPQWDRRYARRYTRSLGKLDRDARASLERVKVLQFLFVRQWQSLRGYAGSAGIQLFGDLPIYVAADSADAWSRRDLLCIETDGSMREVSGVPPDYFDENGQRWGNPVYRWRRHRDTGFAWWIARLRRAVAQVDFVRLDHFRGLESYWSIPGTARSARSGRWINAPGDELLGAIRRALGSVPIVAEDLGVITPAVTALRQRHGIPGMRVLHFDVADPDFDPADIKTDTICYTGTHDNDTTRGWFRGGRDDSRSRAEVRRTQLRALALTGGSAATIHHDLFRLACSTSACMAIAPMQDVLGLGGAARLNRPGSTRGNWRWRMRAGDLRPAHVDTVREIVTQSGRA